MHDNANRTREPDVSGKLSITINGCPIEVSQGATVAAAILEAGAVSRTSVRGQPRQPLCGMGICYECRAIIDGRPHQRTCQILCRPGMQVVTG
jgi:sarcosine oxidase subunit alpha